MLKELVQIIGSASGRSVPSAPVMLADSSGRRPDAREHRQRPAGMAFTRSRGNQKPEPERPPFDLDDIAAAIVSESYLLQAVGKYVDLIFKEGWWLESKDPKAKEFLTQRLAFISEATRIPLTQFLWEIAEDLTKYHNVFIAKVRSPHAIPPPGSRLQGLDGKHPIGGYFVLPPTTMSIRRRPNGEVVGYQQSVPGQDEVDFRAEDIIHIAHRKERGHAFGTPAFLPVIDDVRMLREIEYNVSRLFYLHLHPLYTLTIGKDEQGLEPTPEEFELAKMMMRDIELGGVLYLPGDRYKVDVLGTKDQVMNAEWALKYFERRVLSGIGVPETAFGRSESTNRATADQLTAEMHDRAKALQQVISLYVEEFIFKELLMEGGFDPLLDPESMVYLSFKDIRTDEIIKKENHAIYKYEHNVITIDELRKEIGEEVLSDEDKLGLHLHQVTIPRALAGKSSEESEHDPETDNKARPRNQHGVKATPKSRTKVKEFQDHQEIGAALEMAGRDIERSLLRGRVQDIGLINHLSGKKLKDAVYAELLKATIEGLSQIRDDLALHARPPASVSLLLTTAKRHADPYIEGFLQDWESEVFAIKESAKQESYKEMASKAFARAARRLRALLDVETGKAFWAAYVAGAIEAQRDSFVVGVQDVSCEKCKDMADEIIRIERNSDPRDVLPPFHPGCRCKLFVPEALGEAKP